MQGKKLAAGPAMPYGYGWAALHGKRMTPIMTSRVIRRLVNILLFAALLTIWAGPTARATDYIWIEGESPQIADHDTPPLVV